jgi:hypothetical protein
MENKEFRIHVAFKNRANHATKIKPISSTPTTNFPYPKKYPFKQAKLILPNATLIMLPGQNPPNYSPAIPILLCTDSAAFDIVHHLASALRIATLHRHRVATIVALSGKAETCCIK